MPTYTYQCDDCEYTFDKFQKITDDPEKVCPECEKETLRRLIGAGAGFLFKGSGFYITDYRSKDYKDKASKEQPGSSGETKSTSDKSSGNETKTESTKKSA